VPQGQGQQQADLQPVAAVHRALPAVKEVDLVVPVVRAAEAVEQVPISRR
jgi:hypothetical protein